MTTTKSGKHSDVPTGGGPVYGGVDTAQGGEVTWTEPEAAEGASTVEGSNNQAPTVGGASTVAGGASTVSGGTV